MQRRQRHLQVGKHDRRRAEARGDEADGAAARAQLEHPAAWQVQCEAVGGPRHHAGVEVLREEERRRPDGASLPRRGLVLEDPHASAVAQLHGVVRLGHEGALMIRCRARCVQEVEGAVNEGVC
tara:strand:- start:194 stop:565 length:372 start_codon:yes stop_codon:yes gene_type:complete